MSANNVELTYTPFYEANSACQGLPLNVTLNRPDRFVPAWGVMVGAPPLHAVSKPRPECTHLSGRYRLKSILELMKSPVAAAAPSTGLVPMVGALAAGLVLRGWSWTERDLRFRPMLVIGALR